MRSKIMIIFLIMILVVLNLILYNNEQTSIKGQIFFLKLESSKTEVLPVYGNSISLIYEINGDYSQKLYTDMQSGFGQIVILIDEKKEGKFVRFYDGRDLSPNEALIRYQKEEDKDYIYLLPKSFFFQEGHAKYYYQAKYGVFKRQSGDNNLNLIGLADENKNIIIPGN